MDAVRQGLEMLMQPTPFLFLFLGVVLGLFLGATPGLTGTIGIAILLPMVWGMQPVNVLPLLIGVMAVTATGDTIPAVLFGAPGDTSSTATIMDGYPMAKRGEAARALGASFSASMLGGLFGAVVLTLSIPVARPLLRQFLSPEFFMLCLLGVVLVGGLTGKQPLKGLYAGGLGLLLSTIGGAPGVGYYRFTLGLPYLYGGLPLIIVALGLMALPEIADIFIKGTQVANVKRQEIGKGLWQGYKDTFKNWWLVIRCCTLGAWIGFAPGVGGSGASWIAYSHAVATCKNGNFGKGDVRGVIAPESSNNACKGGDLIPTLLFGIPGSGIMALFLMAMVIIGVRPGPEMIGKNLPLTYTIIWSLALANILAALLCTALARPISRLTMINVHYFAPFILTFILFGAFQANHDWGDFVALFLIGALGWIMKRLRWPRPPLLIGFVLGGLADKYLWLSVAVFGITWFWRPWVLGLFAAMVVSLWFVMRRAKKLKVVEVTAAEEDKED